ncbi:hypothetical protein CHU98_g9592 [Xylaria longipes]|nr:hypothetical protein CHU98_g9592 [Xylaria longipes]
MNIVKLFIKLSGTSNGWKMAAKVNCAILVIASVTLVGLSIAAASSKNSNIIFILSGNCDGNLVSAVNLALHLLINIVSTLVVEVPLKKWEANPFNPQYNFFMQILNAPSREELDNAHSKGSWLGIGVPSVRNGFLVSKFKTWCWIALLISSIPIHLLFNSIIFETDYRGSDFHLTIATEHFVQNGQYFNPGAILYHGQMINYLTLPNNRTSKSYYDETYCGNYGNHESLLNDTDAIDNLSKAAKYGSNWTKIDSRKCWESYISCEGLKIYRDLIVVVDQPAGWTRRDMWQLSTEQNRYWDRFVPSDEPNHLFFHAECTISGDGRRCTNGCSTALGDRTENSAIMTRVLRNGRYYVNTNEYSYLLRTISIPEFPQNGQYSFFGRGYMSLTDGTAPSSYGVWNISDTRRNEELGDHSQRRPGLQPDASHLSMKYCLAEPLERICHIALSPTLLLSVTAAIVATTIVALILTVILSLRNQPPLVTLGDVLASFIEKPDAVTAGFCTLNQSDFKKVKSTDFLPSDKNPTNFNGYNITLAQAILVANSPQLLLSFCYLALNNLFTRMQMAKEWAMFTTTYHPLRVTEPKGEQFATYRLQLPYRYSLPLIAVSIVLHWLLSNAIYIFISIGGYYEYTIDDPSLPPNTGVAVEFSASALLSLIVASIGLISIPILLGLKRLPADSIDSGSNSLALSAACHASTLLYNSRNMTKTSEHDTKPPSPPPGVVPNRPGEEHNGSDINRNDSMTTTGIQVWADPEASELNSLRDSFTPEQVSNGLESGCEQRQRSLRKLAQSKIRWGVVKMPPEWYIEYGNDGPVEHLGFGAEDDTVSPPVSGNFYA